MTIHRNTCVYYVSCNLVIYVISRLFYTILESCKHMSILTLCVSVHTQIPLSHDDPESNCS